MRAAIYSRKSTDDSHASADARSVTRQIAHARAFALKQGWTVDEAHIYSDDGISGALFGARRPGLLRLLNALSPAPSFDILIMSEESRLGREMHQTAHVFGEIIRAGVRIWFYLDGRERTLDTAMDKMMLSLTTFAAELEREKARQRTRDAMIRKAHAGHVTGGRVFGYDNVRIDGHTERRINEREAAVVRDIFERYTRGLGLKAIAHQLNAERAPSPRAQRGRPNGWAPASVREVIGRPLYRGVIEWDRARRNHERRQLRKNENPDVLRVEAPHLAIIGPELAAVVDAKRAQHATTYLTRAGKVKGGRTPKRIKYLFSGFLRCPCGATFEAVAKAYGKRKGGVYICAAHRQKGPTVCANDLHLPIATTDRAILRVLERHLLSPHAVRAAVDQAVGTLADDATRQAHEAELAQVTRELTNLIGALADTGRAQSVVAAIQARDLRRAELVQQLAIPRVTRETLRRQIQGRLQEWAEVLRGEPVAAQRMLRVFLDGPIQIGQQTASGVGWEASGPYGRVAGQLSPLTLSGGLHGVA